MTAHSGRVWGCTTPLARQRAAGAGRSARSRAPGLLGLVVLFVGVGCGDPAPAEPTSWRAIHEEIVSVQCAIPGCHAGPGPTAFLDLSQRSRAYDQLVEVPAMGPACAEMALRVVPGEPDASLLFEKVSRDDPVCGERMPFRRTPLSTVEIERIRDWIAAGALDD